MSTEYKSDIAPGCLDSGRMCIKKEQHQSEITPSKPRWSPLPQADPRESGVVEPRVLSNPCKEKRHKLSHSFDNKTCFKLISTINMFPWQAQWQRDHARSEALTKSPAVW